MASGSAALSVCRGQRIGGAIPLYGAGRSPQPPCPPSAPKCCGSSSKQQSPQPSAEALAKASAGAGGAALPKSSCVGQLPAWSASSGFGVAAIQSIPPSMPNNMPSASRATLRRGFLGAGAARPLARGAGATSAELGISELVVSGLEKLPGRRRHSSRSATSSAWYCAQPAAMSRSLMPSSAAERGGFILNRDMSHSAMASSCARLGIAARARRAPGAPARPRSRSCAVGRCASTAAAPCRPVCARASGRALRRPANRWSSAQCVEGR